jgi:RNA polymerase sigma-70 factor, ECF subfamily
MLYIPDYSQDTHLHGTFYPPFGVLLLQKGGKRVATCEADLIESAAHGDQEAFRRLWEMHHAVAMASALRLCHQRALAEEITQGAFLLAWRGLPRFQPGNPFRPWLLRILYRHALDVMEKQRAYLRPVSLEEVIELEQHLSSDTRMERSDLQEQVAQREEIRQALAQLSPDQRRVVALRYGADLTEVDIAQVLGWPIGTVKSRLNRARERLRVLLNDTTKE